MRVATLIAVGLFGDTGFLVRAAIAIGDLRTKLVQTERGLREIRIGTSMVRAHRLEASQGWVGAAIAPDAPLDSETLSWTVSYAVPLHKSIADLATDRAVNWIAKGQLPHHASEAVRRVATQIGIDSGAQDKIDRTMEFIEFVCGKGLHAPFDIVEG